MNILEVRQKLFKVYDKKIINYLLGKKAVIGRGTVGLKFLVPVSAYSKIKKACLLNYNSSMGDFLILSLNAVILGRVKISDSSFIGTNDVVKDILDNSIIVSTPANRFLR